VYRAAGLSPVTEPKQLPSGERRMLGEQRLEPFVEEVHPESDSPSKQSAAAKKPKPLGRRRGGPAEIFLTISRCREPDVGFAAGIFGGIAPVSELLAQ
jgi:hypothetical protein